MRISDWSSDVCSSDLLDAHGIAERHEGRHRLALLQGLDGALLGEARRAQAGVLVGDGARADDRAGDQRPRPGDVRDQLREIELPAHAPLRSEERRVGKESVRTCRSRLSPSQYTKKIKTNDYIP